MKRAISILSIGILIFSLSFQVFESKSFERTRDESKEEELLNKGFPQAVIETLDSGIIDRVYQKIKADDITEISSNQEIHFIKFPLEGTSGVFTRSTDSVARLKMTVDVMTYMDGAEQIKGCDISLRYEWLVTPGNCSTDVITLGWDPGTYTYSGSMAGYNKVQNMGTGETDYYNFSSEAALAGTGKIGWYAELRSPNISPKVQSNPGGTAYVSFIPAKGLDKESVLASKFQIQYNHRKLGIIIGTAI